MFDFLKKKIPFDLPFSDLYFVLDYSKINKDYYGGTWTYYNVRIGLQPSVKKILGILGIKEIVKTSRKLPDKIQIPINWGLSEHDKLKSSTNGIFESYKPYLLIRESKFIEFTKAISDVF